MMRFSYFNSSYRHIESFVFVNYVKLCHSVFTYLSMKNCFFLTLKKYPWRVFEKKNSSVNKFHSLQCVKCNFSRTSKKLIHLFIHSIFFQRISTCAIFSFQCIILVHFFFNNKYFCAKFE